jgi:hypothetical protein
MAAPVRRQPWPDRASRPSPFALADPTLTPAEPGHRRAAEPCHIALAPCRLAAGAIAPS